MEILDRINSALTETYIACKTELENNSGKYKVWFAGCTTISAAVNGFCIAMAADDIEGLSNTISGKLVEIYSASFGVVTALAALMAMAAWVVRMSGNQQKAAQATSWLIRIALAYIGINLIGLVINVINNSLNHDKGDWFKPKI